MKRLPTMKQLQYLVALADTQHFGRAAERCYITQSTLSAGIRDLEAALGTAVAERTNRQVLVTRTGRQIAERAKAILQEAEEVMEVARTDLAPMTGELRLGVIPTIGAFPVAAHTAGAQGKVSRPDHLPEGGADSPAARTP